MEDLQLEEFANAEQSDNFDLMDFASVCDSYGCGSSSGISLDAFYNIRHKAHSAETTNTVYNNTSDISDGETESNDSEETILNAIEMELDQLGNDVGDVAMNNEIVLDGNQRFRKSKGQKYQNVSNELRERIIYNVFNKGFSTRDVSAVLNVKINTVRTIINVFQKSNRIAKNPKSHRKCLLTQNEMDLIVAYVKANNDCYLKQIKSYMQDNVLLFTEKARNVSIPTISRILKKNKITMKNLDRIPAARNSPNVIIDRGNYVREIMGLEDAGYNLIYVDETGSNLHICRRRGRNLIGKRAVIELPTQRGGNLSSCAAISSAGVLHTKIQFTPFNTTKFLDFMNELFSKLDQTMLDKYIIIMDNVAFHKTAEVRNWFTNHHIQAKYLPAYSPFLNAIEESFCKMKNIVIQKRPTSKETLLQSVQQAFNSITDVDCQGWIRHTKTFYQDCLDHKLIYNEPTSDASDDELPGEREP